MDCEVLCLDQLVNKESTPCMKANYLRADPELPSPEFEPRPQLNVLLVYEDLPTGRRAKQAIDHLLDHSDLDADVRFDLCNFDLLRDDRVNQQMANEAVKADIVVLSARGKRDLPLQVRSWIRRWFEKRGDGPAALVVSLDRSAKESDSSILSLLRELAEPAQVDVFTQFGDAPKPELEWTVERIRQRADTTSSLLEGILHRPQSH